MNHLSHFSLVSSYGTKIFQTALNFASDNVTPLISISTNLYDAVKSFVSYGFRDKQRNVSECKKGLVNV